jgi:hypothetical protein
MFFLSCLLHHHADYHWDHLSLRHHIPLTYDLFDHSYLLTYLTPSMTHTAYLRDSYYYRY